MGRSGWGDQNGETRMGRQEWGGQDGEVGMGRLGWGGRAEPPPIPTAPPLQRPKGRTRRGATGTCCCACTPSSRGTSAASPSTSSTWCGWSPARPCSWRPTSPTPTCREVSGGLGSGRGGGHGSGRGALTALSPRRLRGVHGVLGQHGARRPHPQIHRRAHPVRDAQLHAGPQQLQNLPGRAEPAGPQRFPLRPPRARLHTDEDRGEAVWGGFGAVAPVWARGCRVPGVLCRVWSGSGGKGPHSPYSLGSLGLRGANPTRPGHKHPRDGAASRFGLVVCWWHGEE